MVRRMVVLFAITGVLTLAGCSKGGDVFVGKWEDRSIPATVEISRSGDTYTVVDWMGGQKTPYNTWTGATVNGDTLTVPPGMPVVYDKQSDKLKTVLVGGSNELTRVK